MPDVDPRPFVCALGGKKGFGQAGRQTVGFSPGGGHGSVDRDPRDAVV